MKIEKLKRENKQWIDKGAELLVVCFEHAWDTKEEALEDMEKFVQEERIALVAIEEESVVGMIGAIPSYGKTGWELHPLAVEPSYQSKGIGTKLVAALEEEVYKQGGIIIYLGTDDEDGKTSLSEGDLFEDTYEKIKNIRNLDGHPYAFYEKQGYKIVGVFPDANGFGKPDIWMAKRIRDK